MTIFYLLREKLLLREPGTLRLSALTKHIRSRLTLAVPESCARSTTS